MNSVSHRLEPYLDYALYFGLFVLVADFFIAPENSRYHTHIYLGFYIPAVLAILWQAPALAREITQDRKLRYFCLLMGWLAISISWTGHPDKPHLYKLVAMTWVFVLAVRIALNNIARFNITLGIALSIAVVVILLTLIFHLHEHGTNFYLTRLNQLGQRTVPEVVIGKICAVWMMFCLMQERLVNKLYLRVALAAMALAFMLPIILSFSRTAFLALLLTGLWYLLRNRKTWPSVLIAGTTALLFGVMLMDFQSEWLTNISRSITFEIRLWGWKATWQEIVSSPWFGHGLRSPFLIDWQGTPYTESGMHFYHAHNLLLAIWYDAGVVGLTLLLALLGTIAVSIRPMLIIDEVRYWSYIFFFVLLASMVDGPTLIDRPTGDWLWFWLPLAIAINIDKFRLHGDDAAVANG